MPAKQTVLALDLPPDVLPFADYTPPRDAKNWSGIVLVGEAPGAEEAAQGKPFVGRSGKLLNEVLVAAGIVRDDCLVANVFRRQPPKNKLDHFFLSKRAAAASGEKLAKELGKFSSKYCRADFAVDVNHLQKTLVKWQPRVIVALGRTPFWALTGGEGLLANVGKKLTCRLFAGAPVIATYHPSFILRGNWGLKDLWISHLRMALNQ